MKTVLITGIGGFAAHHLAEYILENTDWNITGLDSFRHRGDAMRIWKDKRVKTFGVDLACGVTNRFLNKLGDVDYIVNMASESHVDRSIDDPVPFVENNVSLALNVFEMSRKLDVDKIIQVSTDEVFGPAPKGVDFKEEDAHIPSNPYAASKSAQEMIGISYWRTFRMPLVIMRAMNMIGERQDPEKFLPMLVKRISRGEEVTIHGTQESGIGTRNYLHAKNFASAIVFVLNQGPVRQYSDEFVGLQRPEMFNVCGNEEIDNFEFARRVAGYLDKDLIANFEDFHKTRPGHDRRYSLDGSLLRSKGWEPEFSLDESIKRVIDFSLKNPEWLEDV